MDDAPLIEGIRPVSIIRPSACRDCRFSFMEGSDRVCRRSPPQSTFMVVPVQRQGLKGVGTVMEVKNFSGFPIVQHDQWCGEFKALLITPNQFERVEP